MRRRPEATSGRTEGPRPASIGRRVRRFAAAPWRSNGERFERRRQTYQAEEAQDAVYARAAQRAGKMLLENALSGYFHAGGDCYEDRADRI